MMVSKDSIRQSTTKIQNKKVVVITGGAGLLGYAFAEALALNGSHPVIADIRYVDAQRAAKKINDKLGYEACIGLKIDITSKNSIKAAIYHTVRKYGHIDALINNAYPRNKNYGRRLEQVEYADFCENLNTHLGGFFLSAQQFAILFKKQGFGHIITVGSIYGTIAPRFDIYVGTQMTMPVEYAAIKSALIHLNAYMVKYFRGTGIRFNCISPGGIESNQPEKFKKNYLRYSAGKKMIHSQEVAKVAAFLVSDQSEKINGQNIIVDDAWSL